MKIEVNYKTAEVITNALVDDILLRAKDESSLGFSKFRYKTIRPIDDYSGNVFKRVRDKSEQTLRIERKVDGFDYTILEVTVV